MEINEFQQRSTRTLNRALSDSEQLLNQVIGLVGEAGEVLDLLKKHRYQGHDLNKKKLAEELGDVFYYLAGIATSVNIELDKVAQGNIDKLLKRYPDGFDPEYSVNRD